MIPGLWENITDAWNGTVGRVVEGVTDLFGGNHTPPAPIEVPKESEEQSPQVDPNEVDGVNPVEADDWRKHSLFTLFNLLRLEAISHAENKAKLSYAKVREVHDKNKALTKLLEIITTKSDNNGAFEAKDDETKRLLAQAKQIGVTVDEKKTKYTKDERDSLVRGIELQSRNLDVDIKLLVNETQEALQHRNTFYQELKTCWDKIIEAVRKLIQAIVSR